MPKMKTNKSVSKRFRKTASGKFKRNKTKRRHLLVVKSSKQKRKLRVSPVAEKTDQKRLAVLLPYA